jgi:hypothetical protein
MSNLKNFRMETTMKINFLPRFPALETRINFSFVVSIRLRMEPNISCSATQEEIQLKYFPWATSWRSQ